jgi:hypothetical protein
MHTAQPDEGRPSRLFWRRNGPWKRTELTSDTVVHHWPVPHTDFLTQYSDYRVLPEMSHLIVMFDEQHPGGPDQGRGGGQRDGPEHGA